MPHQNTDQHSINLKVCGLSQISQIEELISLNTDFLGFIFYPKSPRYVLSHLELHSIADVNHTGKVGVFVNEYIETIVEYAEKAKLKYIQLHGDENETYISELRQKLNPEIKIIKVVRIGQQTPDNKHIEGLISSINLIKNTIDYLLFDTDSKAFGGTGKQFDWSLLNEFEIPLPYFLSGGISEDNIKDIKILVQQPFALDINSKFETEPGIKNIETIKAFKSNLSNSI
ncbi:phosphoribosylanthranilate isomerase [Chryseobacterium sp.]|uniref:phosphoribosylanthranilate isomerase n=1 Tax=Chryseobacterium sp. TaxID=1871047 RepID=UPI0025BE3C40|nr:phosphoribosylanthranilate isomerase [Chryseobacterium sp.]